MSLVQDHAALYSVANRLSMRCTVIIAIFQRVKAVKAQVDFISHLAAPIEFCNASGLQRHSPEDTGSLGRLCWLTL